MKSCTRCNIKKDYQDFNKCAREKDGLQDRCRQCSKELGKIYREKNRDRENARIALYKLNHPKEEAERRKRWAKANPEKIRESADRWIKKNKEAVKTHAARSYLNNIEKRKATNKKYRELNSTREVKNKQNERAREYRKKYPEKRKAIQNRYMKKNRHIISAKDARRRALKKSAYVSWANKEKIQLIYKEAIRLTKITGIQFHVDHIIPLISPYICGLHHENNLQILMWIDNLTKSNKFMPS